MLVDHFTWISGSQLRFGLNSSKWLWDRVLCGIFPLSGFRLGSPSVQYYRFGLCVAIFTLCVFMLEFTLVALQARGQEMKLGVC